MCATRANERKMHARSRGSCSRARGFLCVHVLPSRRRCNEFHNRRVGEHATGSARSVVVDARMAIETASPRTGEIGMGEAETVAHKKCKNAPRNMLSDGKQRRNGRHQATDVAMPLQCRCFRKRQQMLCAATARGCLRSAGSAPAAGACANPAPGTQKQMAC